MQRISFGEEVDLGDLYDGTTDTFCGISMLRSKPKIESEHYFSVITQIKSTNSEILENDISAELSVSILSGLVTLTGYYRHFYDKSKSDKVVSASLLHRAATKTDRINIHHADIRSLISVEAVKNCTNSTHVLVGIEWGANTIVTLQSSRDTKLEDIKVRTMFTEILKAIVDYGSAKENTDDADSLLSQNLKLEMYIHSDVSGIDPSPTTITEARDAIKKIESLIKNNGKVIPVRFTLMPLYELKIDDIILDDRLVLPVDSLLLHRIENLFSDINEAKNILTNVKSTFDQNDFCIPTDINDDLMLKIRSVGYTEKSIKQQISNGLKDVRSGRMPKPDFEALCESAINNNPLKTHQSFVEGLSHVYDRIRFISNAIKNEAVYIGKNSNLNEADRPDEYYMFFYKSSPRNYFIEENEKYFNKLMKEKTACFIADIDSCPYLTKIEGVPLGIRICYYRQGRYIDDDVYDNSKQSVMRASKAMHYDRKPDKQVLLQLVCPASIGEGKYKNDKQFWSCEKCKASVEYGFDDMFYCEYGRAPCNTYEYRCKDFNHMKFVKFKVKILAAELNKLHLTPCVNILLLGETGVGKSTMVNAMANYLKFPDLESAAEDFVWHVPTRFTTTRIVNYELVQHTVSIGSSENDSEQAEQFGTQHPRSYLLRYENVSYRIIDTPGVGNPTGLEKDKINIDNIFKFLSSLDEIHGICIVLKSNHSRLTNYFKICLQEILMNFDKSIVKNLIFCFTFTRSTFYRPGDTFLVLNNFLDNLNLNLNETSPQYDKITLSIHTLYCVDNEAFRYLCMLRRDIPVNSEDFSHSWCVSQKEVIRMLQYIGRKKPHNIRDTMSIYKVRNIILNLVKPMAQILLSITEHIQHTKTEGESISKFKADIVAEPMNNRNTVCSRCKGGDSVGLSVGPVAGSVGVGLRAALMSGVGLFSHPKSFFEKRKINAPSTNYCKECESLQRDTQKKLYNDASDHYMSEEILKKPIQELEKELDEILEIGSKSASYLKYHSIIPYKDAFEKHLRQLMDKASQDDNENSLKCILNDYLEKKKCSDKWFEDNTEEVTANQIDALTNKLIQLAKTGKFSESFRSCNENFWSH